MCILSSQIGFIHSTCIFFSLVDSYAFSFSTIVCISFIRIFVHFVLFSYNEAVLTPHPLTQNC
uniref:Putative ovule protein n=1 Tax=Solanum chacoense TaxID=4108 RepID=A0A0V0HBS6_SOLCH